jgi:yecA family protein
MSEVKSRKFANLQALLSDEKILVHASEIHGLLSGLICGGATFEDSGYQAICNDFFNNGEGFSSQLKTVVKDLYAEIWQAVLDDSYSFQLLLPDDDESIGDRSEAIGCWVQGFNLGFGLKQGKQKKLSEEVAEIINDFVEIANLSDEVEEDEATEQAYYEIVEYVRISSLLCFSELGARPAQPDGSQLVH